MEKNTVQAEVTKFNSMKITSNQSGAEFVDSVETQAKILENLGREVTEDDKLTRLKEGLTDRRYSQLAHSLYTANDIIIIIILIYSPAFGPSIAITLLY